MNMEAKTSAKSRLKPSFKISLTDVRVQMSNCRLAVLNGDVIAVTYFGQVVGYFVPALQLENVQIKNPLEMQLSEFRASINTSWEKLQSGETDCLWLKFRNRKFMGFVAARVWEAL